MHILVTNDDGIFAPGIAALAAALHTLKDTRVTIVAPAQNQSAVGHRKTLHDPLRITQVMLPDGTPGHACSGSPADAIAMALMGYIRNQSILWSVASTRVPMWLRISPTAAQ